MNKRSRVKIRFPCPCLRTFCNFNAIDNKVVDGCSSLTALACILVLGMLIKAFFYSKRPKDESVHTSSAILDLIVKCIVGYGSSRPLYKKPSAMAVLGHVKNKKN